MIQALLGILGGIGKAAMAAGAGAGKAALTAGKTVGKGAVQIGKGAGKVVEGAGKGAINSIESIGKGVKETGLMQNMSYTPGGGGGGGPVDGGGGQGFGGDLIDMLGDKTGLLKTDKQKQIAKKVLGGLGGGDSGKSELTQVKPIEMMGGGHYSQPQYGQIPNFNYGTPGAAGGNDAGINELMQLLNSIRGSGGI